MLGNCVYRAKEVGAIPSGIFSQESVCQVGPRGIGASNVHVLNVQEILLVAKIKVHLIP